MKGTFLYILIGITMFNFWKKGRVSEVAVEIDYVSEKERKAEERRAFDHFTSLVKLCTDPLGMGSNGVIEVVRRSSIETRMAWLKNAKIADEIVRAQAKETADVAQACSNLKIDAAAMIITREEINSPSAVKRASSNWEAIQAEIARFRAENERIRDEEYDQAFDKLGKINETRAVNLAKKHKREMDEERQRAYASIEAEVARMRAEKAAKCVDVMEVPVNPKYP